MPLDSSRSFDNPFALVPSTARTKDIICYIFGCKVPVVLHHIGQHYEALGEAYVHDLMDKDTLQYMSEPPDIVENFALR